MNGHAKLHIWYLKGLLKISERGTRVCIRHQRSGNSQAKFCLLTCWGAGMAQW